MNKLMNTFSFAESIKAQEPSFLATCMQIVLVVAVIGIVFSILLSNTFALIGFVLLAGTAAIGAWAFQSKNDLLTYNQEVQATKDVAQTLFQSLTLAATATKAVQNAIPLLKGQPVLSKQQIENIIQLAKDIAEIKALVFKELHHSL